MYIIIERERKREGERYVERGKMGERCKKEEIEKYDLRNKRKV